MLSKLDIFRINLAFSFSISLTCIDVTIILLCIRFKSFNIFLILILSCFLLRFMFSIVTFMLRIKSRAFERYSLKRNL